MQYFKSLLFALALGSTFVVANPSPLADDAQGTAEFDKRDSGGYSKHGGYGGSGGSYGGRGGYSSGYNNHGGRGGYSGGYSRHDSYRGSYGRKGDGYSRGYGGHDGYSRGRGRY